MTRIKPADRGAGLSRLMVELAAVIDRGELVPCVDPRRGHLWISDDPVEQQAAAHGCTSCPALAACGRYVADFPETAGTWAGRSKSLPRVKR